MEDKWNISCIRDLLPDSKLFVRNVEHGSIDGKGNSVGISWKPYVKWRYCGPVEDGDAFLFLMHQWLEVQKEHTWLHPAGKKERSSMTLITELFGTPVFSGLEIAELTERTVFRGIETCMISDHDDEKRRQKEIRSMRHAVGIAITCLTGDTLYFGKTPEFYFLISKQYIKQIVIPVGKNIQDILFGGNRNEAARKRPGMYIGSLSRMGLYRMLFGLIEDLLKDAAKKEISIRLLPQDTVEIVCTGYSAGNNTCYINQLSVVSALSDFFDYQEPGQSLRTEKGLLTAAGETSQVTEGIKIVWRPDISVFGCIDLDYYVILNRMIEIASLYPYKIRLSDRNNQNMVDIPAGIGALLNEDYFGMSSSKIIPIEISDREFYGRAAISFGQIAGETRRSYVNGHITWEGGVHADGVIKGTRNALKRILELYDNSLTPGSIIKQLNYVINIQMDKPRFQGAVREKLKNIEVGPPVQRQVEQQVYEYLKEDITPLRRICHSDFDERKKLTE